MKYVYQYNTDQEKQTILQQNSDKLLIEEHNISSGNFLVFTDETRIENKIEALRQDNLILMDAIATLFEEILILRGEA